jgi:hypothetical protein
MQTAKRCEDEGKLREAAPMRSGREKSTKEKII